MELHDTPDRLSQLVQVILCRALSSDSSTIVPVECPDHPSDKILIKQLDYSLYNKVKANFPPEPGTVIFVSLAPENLEAMHFLKFTLENIDDLGPLTWLHENQAIPYVCIGGFDLDKAEISF